MEFLVQIAYSGLLLISIFISEGRSAILSTESTLSSLPFPVYNEKTYVYLIMVPDYDLQRLTSQRLRQDEDDGGSGGGATPNFGQTGMFIGQIISGVLNFDTRPVFAGSVGFVEDPSAQQNLGTFLGTIAPAMNLFLREMYNRAQIALGIATTRRPQAQQPDFIYEEPLITMPNNNKNGTMASNSNSNSNQNPNKINAAVVSNALPQVVYGSNYTVQEQLAIPEPTTSWEHVLHQILRETTTTVEPLPFLRLRTTTRDPDDDGEESRVKIH